MAFGKQGLAYAAREISELVQSDLLKVERAIALESVSSVDAVTSIGRYLHLSGGKRLRPTLLLLCNGLVGRSEAAVRLAAVVEMIHAATLVHDDVIDIAQTRRGKPSTNAVWGNQTSVLAGDWLYMQAFQIALRERNFRILDVLISLTQLMVEGELLQLERIGKLDVSEADYMDLVDRKTAGLFSVCARLGAVAGDASESAETVLAEAGWNLGMAFQLVDDLLDFTSSEDVLGKPVGSDLREGKVTLPLIYALERATEDERILVATVLMDRSYERAPFEQVFAVLERCEGLARARQRAREFADKARASLVTFPESPYQRALISVAHLVVDRDH